MAFPATATMMGVDEDATLAAWWRYRDEVIDPGIERPTLYPARDRCKRPHIDLSASMA